MTPRAGAELSQGRSPADRPSAGTPRQPGGAGGGAPTTRQVTILLSRRAKLLSLNTLGQRAHFLFPFRADARGVRQTQHPAVQLHLRVGPHGRTKPPQGLRGD